ncbi:hypothetical protein [Brevundimonas sp.]|uniref:hypothetical protein n=1 Tax=Brevundimonas sp. TaxID=1871086 RepID=UPI0028A0EE28|nr:hypothetical protein [Brevundimonas sp.]
MPLLLAAGLTGCQFIPGTDSNTVAKAKAAVAAKLKDPTSALFSDIKVVEGGVCGQVNGKNSYGAYEGNTGFVWFLGSAHIEDVNAAQDINSQLEQCLYRALASACTEGKSLYGNNEYEACNEAALEAIRRTYS